MKALPAPPRIAIRMGGAGVRALLPCAAMAVGLGLVLLAASSAFPGGIDYSSAPAVFPGVGDAVVFRDLSVRPWAGHGYAPFFPLYPILIRLLTPVVGGHRAVAAIVISLIATSIGLWALTALTERFYGDIIARRAAWYALLSPVSFYLLNGYSEGLFFGLAAVCLLCASRARWGWAGIAGAAACLTRLWGIFLFPALLAAYIEHCVSTRSVPVRWQDVAGIMLVPLAWLAWVLFIGHSSGNLLEVFVVEHEQFRRSLTLPLAGMGMTIPMCFVRDYPLCLLNLDKLVWALGWAFVMWHGRRVLWTPLLVYLASGAALLCLAAPEQSVPWWNLDRFLMVLVPGYMVLAQMPWRPAVHRLALCLSAALLLALWTLFVHGYAG